MRYLCKFNSIEMSKNKNTSQPTLEELYTTDDLVVLKRAITELTTRQDYKTLNTLFRRNPNASKIIFLCYKIFTDSYRPPRGLDSASLRSASLDAR